MNSFSFFLLAACVVAAIALPAPQLSTGGSANAGASTQTLNQLPGFDLKYLPAFTTTNSTANVSN